MSFAAASRLATSFLKPLLLLAAILALAACGRSPTSHVGIPGDNDPHDGVRRHPATAALRVEHLLGDRHQFG